MVEVEMAHGDDVDAAGIEARRAHRRHDRRALVLAHRAGLLVEPLPDPRLDQHAPGRRLDQQAVERLEQPPVLVELALRPRRATGSTARARRSRRSPCGRSRPARARPASRRRGRRSSRPRRAVPWPSPPSRVVALRPRSKSAWKADAVGSDWPWYFDPSSLAPVRPLDRRAHPEEADLPDPHAGVQGDRQVGDVRELERERALPARVDVARRSSGSAAPGGPESSTSPRAARRGRRAARPTRASGPARTRPGGG